MDPPTSLELLPLLHKGAALQHLLLTIIKKRFKSMQQGHGQGQQGHNPAPHPPPPVSASSTAPAGTPPQYQDILTTVIETAQTEGDSLDLMDTLAQVKTFLFALQDTTASTVAWAMYSLSQSRDIERRVYEEVLAVCVCVCVCVCACCFCVCLSSGGISFFSVCMPCALVPLCPLHLPLASAVCMPCALLPLCPPHLPPASAVCMPCALLPGACTSGMRQRCRAGLNPQPL